MGADENKPDGHLNKEVLRRFIEFGCDRQLALDLGRHDERWLDPPRAIASIKRPGRSPDLLLEMGQIYEQDVYARLRHSSLSVEHAVGSHDHVVSRTITPSLWRQYAAQVPRGSARVLLEHEWQTPENVLTWILDTFPGTAIPIANPSQRCRPDIIVLEERRGSPDRQLSSYGVVSAVEPDDPRVAIRLIDIKHTNPDDVGKKQFIELLFYAHSLAFYLDEHGLTDLYFVSLDGHGIWPSRNLNRLRLLHPGDLDEPLIPMEWDDHAHLFELVSNKVRELYSLAPRPIEDIDVHIQSSCARCRYVADCKSSLGFDEDARTLGEVDVRLVPCTSPSISEQLRDLGISTADDLARSVDQLDIPTDVPGPLFAERPLLRLKAQALSSGGRVLPSAQSDADLRHMSIALPQYANVTAAFNAEADPANDCVFAFGVHLDVSCAPSAPYAHVHDAWWQAVHDVLTRHRRPRNVDVAPLLDCIDAGLVSYFLAKEDDLTRASLQRRLTARINLFVATLLRLRGTGRLELIEPGDGGTWRVQYTYAFVAQGYAPEQERRLAINMVEQFQAIVSLTSIYEELVATVDSDPETQKSWILAPSSGIFYWSRDQLEHVQALLERHLTELLTDPAVCTTFHELLQLLNPAESSVQRDFLHKKIFDLRAFVERCVGLPQIINYTWHQIAEQELRGADARFSTEYWPDNFNYMDFLAWHQYLKSQDTALAEPLRVEAGRKASTIARLVRHFQQRARQEEMLPRLSRAIPTHSIPWHARLVGDDLNFMARAWALYSRLTASVDAQEALTTRLDYPTFSIGKLVAAHADDLVGWIDPADEKTQWLEMSLTEISANMKLSEGDYVLLVHETRRGAQISEHSGEHVVIEELEWDPNRRGYRARARSRRSNHPYFSEYAPVGGQWYLYPSSSDTWSTKLFEGKVDTLYDRYDLGTSWLGDRAAYLLDLLPPDRGLGTHEDYTFSTAEVTMYAPSLLPTFEHDPGAPLQTTAFPAPDPSQREAIHMALASTVSCIQGPPGTGKSQTIASLIDEFIARRQGQPVKILVASASYVPLHVVLEKVLEQRDAQGHQTAAASMQKLFLRGSYRDPVDIDGVHDLYRDSSNTLVLDGQRLGRGRDKTQPGGWKRMETYLDDSFIMFAPAQQLFYLGRPSGTKAKDFHFVHDDFAFDLIVVDEASQMPVDQALTSMSLVRRGRVRFDVPGLLPGQESLEDRAQLGGMSIASLVDHLGEPMPLEHLTRVVVVGDHNQLPPVQKVEVSERLQPVLGSLFTYFVRHHQVPSHQLTINYRSRPEIVGYTRHLGLYARHIDAFHDAEHAYPPLAPPPGDAPEWLQHVLSDECVVSALVHNELYETSVSPLEASIVCQVVEAFMAQVSPDSPDEERAFWREHVGIVAPHNAQGRLITRTIADALLDPRAPRTALEAAELEGLLRGTIYTVDKFQGSARTFIIASIGVSAVHQLAREETFIYDMNRLNVLTSRARQKMLMICSQSFLDYTPRNRDVVPAAARSRDYALTYCNRFKDVRLTDHQDRMRMLRLRWHDPAEPLASVPKPPPRARPNGVDATPPEEVNLSVAPTTELIEEKVRALVGSLGLDYDTLPEHQRVMFTAQVASLMSDTKDPSIT
jgi:hypothetical protein